ncbi:MAG: hypothetical protein JWM88_1909 [Verrucomicrobia bacterium]|nr:hypothetical protein [Verrucomicrobiota bacterium]
MTRDLNPPGTGGEGTSVINPLEIADWDAQVAAFPAAGFFHSRAWLSVLQETYGYTPLYIVKKEDGRLRSMLPLLEVKSWLTGSRGVSLPFTDGIEPLCADAAGFREIFAVAQSLGRSRRWKYVECRGGKSWMPAAPASTRFHNHILNLEPGEQKLFAGFEPAVQRAIRKSERGGLTIELAQTEEAIRAFYGLLCKTRQRHGVPPQPYRFFAAIQRHILAANRGWVVLARQGTIPVAASVYFHFGREVIYKFGASDAAFQHLRANNLVMWQAIRHCARERFEVLDLGRTSLTNEGLRRFKLAWGTRERVAEYLRYDIPDGKFVAVPDESSGWHTRIFNVLPLWVSRRIGAALYPHMG